MGKAADNERIKLRATWDNNVSIGLFLGGAIIPYLALGQNPELQQKLYDWGHGKYQPTDMDGRKLFVVAAALVIALATSWIFRVTAHREIQKIQD
jgi:hypothetical protein